MISATASLRAPRVSAAATVVALAALVLALVPVTPVHAQEPPFNRGIEQACLEGARTAEPFADVTPGATHSEAISCLWAYGIAQGRIVGDDTVYLPDNSVSRQQMASFIARMIGFVPDDVYPLPEPREDALFDDSEDISSAHLINVNVLADLGIAEGFPDGTYRPRLDLDRAQMASFIVRSIEAITEQELDRAAVFDDISGTHQANIEKLASIGVTDGVAVGLYAPDEPITRAQMASFIARSLDYLAAEGVIQPLAFDEGTGAGLGLTEVDAAVHDTYDRVALTLEGDDGLVGYRIQYVEEARAQGSGDLIEIDGDAILEVNLTGMAYPADLPSDVEDALVDIGSRIALDGSGIVEVHVGTIFEGYQQVFIGTTGNNAFDVGRLEDPQRLFIDVEHAS